MKNELFVNNFVIENINMLNGFGVGQTYYLKKELLEIEFKHDKTIITDLTNALTNFEVKKYIVYKQLIKVRYVKRFINSIKNNNDFIRVVLDKYRIKNNNIPGIYKYSPFSLFKVNKRDYANKNKFISKVMNYDCIVSEVNYINEDFKDKGIMNKEYFIKKFVEVYSKNLYSIENKSDNVLFKYGTNIKSISFEEEREL